MKRAARASRAARFLCQDLRPIRALISRVKPSETGKASHTPVTPHSAASSTANSTMLTTPRERAITADSRPMPTAPKYPARTMLKQASRNPRKYSRMPGTA